MTESSNPPIEIDASSRDDDSSYGDELCVYLAILRFKDILIRLQPELYHFFELQSYQFPNDEKEQDRLDLAHYMITSLLDGKLHLAPLPSDPSRILDIGTGTGIWAIEADRGREE
ncbi:MAG: hypothetical protein M1834_006429 [Cirrosporium novae-zelandiae]|nr:MAG: hypothetical protein M1834_006429 [Cirrosporium novae-zelandiae]